jgi:hypothetical protein
MNCQSLGASHCQNGVQSRGDIGPLMRPGLGSGSKGVQSMGKENSNAQNNQKCGNSFKHRPGPAQSLHLRGGLLHSQKYSLSGLNFPPRDDFEQQIACRACRRLIDNPDLPASHRRTASVASASMNPMTPSCPVCEEPMKKRSRPFRCEPCRQIIIFVAVSDASPYIASRRVSEEAMMRQGRDRHVNVKPPWQHGRRAPYDRGYLS